MPPASLPLEISNYKTTINTDAEILSEINCHKVQIIAITGITLVWLELDHQLQRGVHHLTPDMDIRAMSGMRFYITGTKQPAPNTLKVFKVREFTKIKGFNFNSVRYLQAAECLRLLIYW